MDFSIRNLLDSERQRCRNSPSFSKRHDPRANSGGGFFRIAGNVSDHSGLERNASQTQTAHRAEKSSGKPSATASTNSFSTPTVADTSRTTAPSTPPSSNLPPYSRPPPEISPHSPAPLEFSAIPITPDVGVARRRNRTPASPNGNASNKVTGIEGRMPSIRPTCKKKDPPEFLRAGLTYCRHSQGRNTCGLFITDPSCPD